MTTARVIKGTASREETTILDAPANLATPDKPAVEDHVCPMTYVAKRFVLQTKPYCLDIVVWIVPTLVIRLHALKTKLVYQPITTKPGFDVMVVMPTLVFHLLALQGKLVY